MSNNHCSYCDCLLRLSDYTPNIEHFRPKKLCPNLEKVWCNLFSACPKCNTFKGHKCPTIKPLKPDTNVYSSFNKWFEIDPLKYEIRANKFLNNSDKERAETTITWLGLNDYERISARKREYESYLQSTNKNINDYSYRFFIKLLQNIDY